MGVSVKYFFDSLIKPYILESKYLTACEIGASYGEHTDRLLEIPGLRLTLIDPCMDADLVGKYRGVERVHVIDQKSLVALPGLDTAFDCFLIDGDHNWYTVYHELKLIEERRLLNPKGIIFLHDTGYPYGRRDIYFTPSDVPTEFRQEYSTLGIVKGQSELVAGGDNEGLPHATHEGGARNGVLTAVEDFAKEYGYAHFSIEEQHGLTVLSKSQTPAFLKWRLKHHPLVTRARASLRARLGR